jgi:poly-gamma-glutamate capsule biosynthesis protein CapA/YwtB (metallophosphatase superfamily)
MYIMTNIIQLLATGDLGPCRPVPDSIFLHSRERLSQADLVFGQLEPALTGRGDKMPQARLAMRAVPDTAGSLADAGFDLVSFASNHSMDWGTTGLLDTCAHLKAAGIQLVGAGPDIEAARQATIKSVESTRIAFLARNSIVPMGYAAEKNREGCAPMRAWTHYEQIEHDQPGTPSRTHSFAQHEDIAQLITDIKQAKEQADVVVLSMHWGIHFVPAVIADYQRDVAHAAIDGGVDIVIGHHPHVLKGVEVYSGKVIIYSLGNFAIDPPTAFDKNLRSTRAHQEITELNSDWEDDGDHVTLRDSAMAIVARCDISAGRIQRVSALPVYINHLSQPEFVTAKDPRFSKIAAYLRSVTQSQKLNGAFTIDGDELEIGF